MMYFKNDRTQEYKTTIDTYCDVFEANEQKNVNIMNTYLQENNLVYTPE